MSLHIAETLSCASIENFLSESEIGDLQLIMSQITPSSRNLAEKKRKTSIHEIPGLSNEEAKMIYEPFGRLELTDIPYEVARILSKASDRAMPQILRQFPSVDQIRPWVYVEYGIGQYITPHADGLATIPSGFPRQVAGISVSITNACSGGQFFIETTSCSERWDREESKKTGISVIREGSDNSSSWFRKAKRTRWIVEPAPGDALLYGSQLVHGTLPVNQGIMRKFISWYIQSKE